MATDWELIELQDSHNVRFALNFTAQIFIWDILSSDFRTESRTFYQIYFFVFHILFYFYGYELFYVVLVIMKILHTTFSIFNWILPFHLSFKTSWSMKREI